MGNLKSRKRTQQSVHLTCGILRGLQAFFWLRAFSAPKQSPACAEPVEGFPPQMRPR